MRFVTWNCCGGYTDKHAALMALDPDLAIICEIKQRDAEAIDGAHVFWTGRTGAKGMAILGRNGWQIEPIAEGREPHVLVVKASKDGVIMTVVGVWTVPAAGSYVRPILTAINELSEHLTGDVIVAGDFNANPKFRGKPRFEEAKLALRERGLESIWHARSGEEHGEEQTATLYWRWNLNHPFHVDYIFATPRLRAHCRELRIGTFDEWVGAKLSDHVPLIADFNLG